MLYEMEVKWNDLICYMFKSYVLWFSLIAKYQLSLAEVDSNYNNDTREKRN